MQRMTRRDQIFALLCDYATDGLPCPTNVDIAGQLGLSQVSCVARSIGELVENGSIVRETVEPRRRRITITATGQSTGIGGKRTRKRTVGMIDCLCCGRAFKTENRRSNRICVPCKNTDAFRVTDMGGLYL